MQICKKTELDHSLVSSIVQDVPYQRGENNLNPLSKSRYLKRYRMIYWPPFVPSFAFSPSAFSPLGWLSAVFTFFKLGALTKQPVVPSPAVDGTCLPRYPLKGHILFWCLHDPKKKKRTIETRVLRPRNRLPSRLDLSLGVHHMALKQRVKS